MTPMPETPSASRPQTTRRGFLEFAALGMGIAGVSGGVWVLANSFGPAADDFKPDVHKVDDIPEGAWRIIAWRGFPVIVHHRTPEQIEFANVTAQTARHRIPEHVRAPTAAWFVGIFLCTRLKCTPRKEVRPPFGRFGQHWFCPCCAARYDLSGRVLSGPAPRDLDLPPYEFDDSGRLLLGRPRWALPKFSVSNADNQSPRQSWGRGI